MDDQHQLPTERGDPEIMPKGFNPNCPTCMGWGGGLWDRPENTREIIHHDDGTHTLIRLDGIEIILGPGPTPTPEPGLVPVEQALPPLLAPLDWTIDDDDVLEEDREEDQEYWENSKVRRLMEGGDAQDKT